MDGIHDYYARYAEENRLFDGRQHHCEYLVTMHLLRKYMPIHGAKILDCCAGAGAYAFALAAEGARVTAGDLVPVNAEKMCADSRAGSLAEIYTGSADDLSRFAGESFDGVLCMGALYHLPDPADRDRVLRECLRVLRPGGVLALAWHSVQALYLATLLAAVRKIDPAERRTAFAAVEETARTHRRDVFFGMTFDEIEAIAPAYGLTRITAAATYPALYSFFTALESLPEEEYAAYVSCLLETCEDEYAARHAMHGLYLARKPVS